MATSESKPKKTKEDMFARRRALAYSLGYNEWEQLHRLEQLNVSSSKFPLAPVSESRQISLREVIQSALPLDRQWRQLDPEAMTRAGKALVAKHPEIGSSDLSPERRRGLLYDQWKVLRDKWNRDRKLAGLERTGQEPDSSKEQTPS